jgi:hypothetical protein
VTSKGFYFELFYSPDLVIGVSALPQTLSPQQLEMIETSAKGQASNLFRGTYADFTKQDPTKALADLFQKDKGPSAKTDFLFFSGNNKVGFEVNAKVVQKVSADMVVLDKQLQPILATVVTLLAPARD